MRAHRGHVRRFRGAWRIAAFPRCIGVLPFPAHGAGEALSENRARALDAFTRSSGDVRGRTRGCRGGGKRVSPVRSRGARDKHHVFVRDDRRRYGRHRRQARGAKEQIGRVGFDAGVRRLSACRLRCNRCGAHPPARRQRVVGCCDILRTGCACFPGGSTRATSMLPWGMPKRFSTR